MISGKSGERLFDHIVFDKYARSGGGFTVGNDFFSTHSSAIADAEIQSVKIHKHGKPVTRQGLVSFDLNKSATRALPKTHIWGEGEYEELPYIGLLFIQGPKEKILDRKNKNRTGVSVRCPQSVEFWKEWVRAEQLGDKETTKTTKQALREKFTPNIFLEDQGCKVVLPSEYEDQTERTHYNSYLIAMTAGSSFEAVYARQGHLPNTYRLECSESGEIKLINPREEAKKALGI